eukprot:16198911-Heterocapsa_arctica.AAC.1
MAGDDEDAMKPPVDDNEVPPGLTNPADLSLPPWIGASIDTNDNLRKFYMPADRGLGHFTTMQDGVVRIDSLTTRDLMEYRVIWDQGIGWTIPPWATHLNSSTCRHC